MSAIEPEGKCQTHLARFPKSHRLTKTDEFSSVFSFRKALRTSTFLLHYRPREIEQAGGASTTGRVRILEIQPTELHQRVPVIIGSKQEVELVTSYH